MISVEKLTTPLPWLASLTVFVWLVLVALQIFMPAKPLTVEALPAPAPAVQN